MTHTENPAAPADDIAAARLLLNKMGIDPSDLLQDPADSPDIPSTRMALPDGRLSELSAVAASTGNDPALDSLIIRLHTETACRRGGALALTPEDLDPGQCLIRLHEKGGTGRWQPVSPTLMTHLPAHVESRGSLDSGERLLRYATGKPITARRYDYLWDRLGEHLSWVRTQQVSTHWIRHTILTWVERRFGSPSRRHTQGTRKPAGAHAPCPQPGPTCAPGYPRSQPRSPS